MRQLCVTLDHVHVAVRDREASADWYGKVLGLERDARVAAWAIDRTQPLFVGSASSRGCLALFERQSGEPPRSGDHTIGLRVTGDAFLAFLARLDTLRLTHRDGGPLTRESAVDHGAAWSLHLLDPDGNRIELTTYDRDQVTAALTRPASDHRGAGPASTTP